jgi:hypothetical protein
MNTGDFALLLFGCKCASLRLINLRTAVTITLT